LCSFFCCVTPLTIGITRIKPTSAAPHVRPYSSSAFDLGLYPTLNIHRSQRGRSGRDLKCLLSRKERDLMPNTHV
jgi:hypothetical protein